MTPHPVAGYGACAGGRAGSGAARAGRRRPKLEKPDGARERGRGLSVAGAGCQVTRRAAAGRWAGRAGWAATGICTTIAQEAIQVQNIVYVSAGWAAGREGGGGGAWAA